jgi:two-component system, OmpR family, sensor histidine kinase CiaH
MFKSARFKLTFWYVLIIMIISGMFSAAAYQNFSQEIERGFRQRRVQMMIPLIPNLEDDLIAEVKQRLILELLITNGIILLTAGALSYFLAGKTLNPIEKMMEEQKRFVSDASHELRTPLTSLKTEIEVALRDKKMTIIEAKRQLKSNLEEVDKMQVLTNYLLSLNKYQSGQTGLIKKEIKMSEVINKSIVKLKNKLKDKNITITKNIEEVKMWGNEISLEELMVIFLDNAIKYSHKEGEIRVSLNQDSHHIRLTISDNGVGIAESDLPFIFDRFYRAEVSRTKEETEGYGIGLAIAKNIVEMHGGKIEVTSQQGIGSTFSVIFKKEVIG